MLKRASIAIGILSVGLSTAVTVHEWNGLSSSKWHYIPLTNEIEITASDSGTFSFEAFDSLTGNPVDIDLVSVHSGVSGTVNVKIAADPGSARTYGAANVKGIDLHNATAGNLAGVFISGNLGATSGVNVKDVSGAVSALVGTNVSVTGNLGAALTLTSANSISVTGSGTHTGNISLTAGAFWLLATPLSLF